MTFTLSEKQQHVLQQLIEFFHSTDSCFVLKGYAGTGKTTMLKHVARYLQMKEMPFQLVAPTGRAAKNIYERLKDEVVVNPITVHSFLYEKIALPLMIKDDDEIDDNELRLVFRLRKLELPFNQVLIVDEASMLSHITQEQEHLVFGSGNVFKDLLEYMSLDNSRRKVLFIGDDMQLPPIGSSESSVLQPKYLEQYISGKIPFAELTEVFRQKEGGILANATRLREEITRDKYDYFPIKHNDFDIFNLSFENALKQYREVFGKQSIFLAAMNEDVHRINLAFRELKNLHPLKIEQGERLVLMRNSWIAGAKVYNGEFISVLDVGKIECIEVSFKKKGGGIKKVELQFQDLIVGFYDEANKPTSAKCKILLSKLWEQQSSFNVEDHQALIALFTMQHPHIKKNSEQYKEAISLDPYFNVLFVRFGYAITCHKAQGGEWNQVFSLTNMSRNLYCQDSFRWMYTALTRAKQSINFINLPVTVQPKEDDIFHTFRPLLFEKLVSLGYTFINESEIQFGFKYTLEKNKQKAFLVVYYTGKSTLGSARKEKGELDIDDILALLASNKGRMLSDVTPL